MNPLVRWDPFKEMQEMQSRLGSWFGQAPRKENGSEALTVADWTPLVDITEDAKEFLVKAELPEIKREDVKVTVEDGLLTISGERKLEKEETNRKYHRLERSYGSFVRSFGLPEGTDAGKVVAEFKDGVLLVHLPKSEQAKPKSVEIKVQ